MHTVYARFIAALQAMQVRGGVLVALSGGADSVCLLDLFCTAKQNGDFPYGIAAAHVNHCLRGAESDRDAHFCEEICKERGIPLFVKTVDVGALAKAEGKGVEEAARDVRYSFFESLLASEGLSHVATAHHQGDFCETMLLNLVRGSGIDGLCSIPRVRDSIVRPLLDCSRAEIDAYIHARGLSFVTDSTNASVEYSRNRIRHRVLPEFAQISQGYAESMVRTGTLLSRDADFLRTEAAKAYDAVVQDRVLDTKKAQNLHSAILTRVLKMLYTAYGFSRIALAHLDAIAAQIADGKENFTLSLPDSVCICERGALTFAGALPREEDFSFPIELEKPVTLPNGITVLLSERDTGGTPLRREALCGNLTVRSRKEGDVLRRFGRTHKIKRMIADAKLSAAQKNKLFFLCANDTVLYTNLPAVSDSAFCKRDGGQPIFINTEENV